MIAALEAGFPVLRTLVGQAYFAAMATEFLRQHPPRSRILMLYGNELAGFVRSLPAVPPHLSDIVRLEQALRESYHAAGATPLTGLNHVPEGVWLTSRLHFAPSLRLIASPWPIFGIWRMHTQNGPPSDPGGEDVLVLRPVYLTPHHMPCHRAGPGLWRSCGMARPWAMRCHRQTPALLCRRS